MKLKIDGHDIETDVPGTILQVALRNGIYIPHLCAHPELDPTVIVRSAEIVYQGSHAIKGEPGIEFSGCDLCCVEVAGRGDLCQACRIMVEDGMEVSTLSPKVIRRRKARIAEILEHHPHACLICAQSAGCDRALCSSNVPEIERCCFKFGECELQKIAEHIGIEQGLPPYTPLDAPVVNDDPVVRADYNLCIGCIRCVRVCGEVKGANALAFTVSDGQVFVGTKANGRKESGCKFCGMCIEMCPTGALAYNYERKRLKKRPRLKSPTLPPEKYLRFLRENVEHVPETEGVYMLYDGEMNLYKVAGVENLRESLLDDLEAGLTAFYFSYEEDLMFTARERQVIQQCIAKTGRMPPGNEDLDDLF